MCICTHTVMVILGSYIAIVEEETETIISGYIWFRVQALRLRVKVLRFRVQGLRLKVRDLRLLGLRV